MAAAYELLDAEGGGLEEPEVEGGDPPTAAPTAAALRREVAQYRMDCGSKVADCCWATGACVGRTKAKTFSWPCVTAVVTALGRLAFLADYASDIQVGLTLRAAGNPVWGTIVLSLVCVPYICMAAALMDHAAERMLKRWQIPQLAGKAIWLVVAFPVLLLADVTLALKYFCWIPTSTETFHYMSLRKIMELMESVPQLILQIYIYMRLVNPRKIFPSVTGASVDARLLTVSIGFSCYTLVEIYGFLTKFARVQGHGSTLRFLRMMSRLGEGLAPSILYEQLEKDRIVAISFDLAGTSIRELNALAQTAKTSPVLEKLTFSDASWLQSLPTHVHLKNLIGQFLRATNLVSFSVGPGLEPATYEAAFRPVAEEVLKEHPTLRVVKVEDFDDLRGQSWDGADSTTLHELVKAVRSGEAEEAEALLPAAPMQAVQQALREAVAAGRFEVLRAMLSHPTQSPQQVANQPLENEDRPLHIAARWRQTPAAGLLLVARADADLANNLGRSVVWEAAFHGSVEVLRRLLDARGSPNLQHYPESSPVLIASQQNTAEALKHLLVARGDPNLQMHDGRSPVYAAAVENSVEALEQLLASRGDPNLQANNGVSPVYAAAQKNAKEALEQLLASRGDPNLQANNGTSPVYAAAEKNAKEALQLLLAARGDLHLKAEGVFGMEPIHAAADFRAAEALEQLLEKRADPNLRCDDGRSPVYFAAAQNATEALQLLLTNRGDPNRRMENGQSPVHEAAFKNASEAVQLLLTANGNPNLTNEGGHTPIHFAAHRNSTEALEQLLVARGEPSIRDHEGQTPMDLARSANATEALALLQRHA